MILLAKDPSFKKIFLIFLFLKFAVIFFANLYFVIPSQFSNQEGHLDNRFLNLFAQYDASAYLDIAKNGYNENYFDGAGNYSYFPLYPILIKLFSFLFGIGWSALIVSNILSFLSVCLLYIYLKEEFGEKISVSSVKYFLIFPVAYFFTMMYTESLFFFLMMLMFYYAKRNNWLLVGIYGFLATATRMYGIVLFFPMFYLYLKERKLNVLSNFKIKKLDFKMLYFLLIPLALFLLYAYFYVTTGNFFKAFDTFGKPVFGMKADIPGKSYLLALFQTFTVFDPVIIFYNLFSFVLIIFFVWSTVYWLKEKEKRVYGIFMFSYLILVTSHTLIWGNSRYMMLLFPGFVLLAQKIDEKNKTHLLIRNAIFLCSFALLALFTIWHSNQGIFLQDLIKYLF